MSDPRTTPTAAAGPAATAGQGAPGVEAFGYHQELKRSLSFTDLVSIAGACFVTIGMGIYFCTDLKPVLPLLLFAGAVNALGRSLQQPPIAALISKISKRSEQGTVFGLYHGLIGVAALPAGFGTGWIWDHWGARWALSLNAACAGIASLLLFCLAFAGTLRRAK